MSKKHPHFCELGARWGIVLVSSVVLGGGCLFVTYHYSPPAGQWLGLVTSRVRTDRWLALPGFLLICAVLSHIIIYQLLHFVRSAAGQGRDLTRYNMITPALVGYSEAFLYPLALVWGVPELIGVWLAIKVAGSWGRWTGPQVNYGEVEPGSAKEKHILKLQREARETFNIFLVGNAASILLNVGVYSILRVCVLVPESSHWLLRLIGE